METAITIEAASTEIVQNENSGVSVEVTNTTVTVQEATKKMPKTAFIDNLYLLHTNNGKTQIPKDAVAIIFKEVVNQKYIDANNEREVKATMSTIRCRPWHLRKAGKMVESQRGSNKE